MLEERARNRTAVERPPADVEDGLHERVVHRHRPLAVPRGARRHERGNGLADRERHVLDDVMPKVAARA